MPAEVTLADKVDFLGAAKTYLGERPEVVQARETHMSWVFLTDRFAYKLKKPVRHNHVDLRALDARRRNCLTEIRVNRRLAGRRLCRDRAVDVCGAPRTADRRRRQRRRVARRDATAAGRADARSRLALRWTGAAGPRPGGPQARPVLWRSRARAGLAGGAPQMVRRGDLTVPAGAGAAGFRPRRRSGRSCGGTSDRFSGRPAGEC